MTLRVRAAGAQTTVQDRGRPGLAHLGVPRAGALDDRAADLANRLVGNQRDAALLEVTLGAFEVEAVGTGHWVAVTGAPALVSIEGAPVAHGEAVWLAGGTLLRLGTPATGVRSYLAVAGGVDVAPVLGSRSTDTLAWVGPPRVVDGSELPVADPAGPPRPHDTPRPATPSGLRLMRGPRADWFADEAVELLCSAAYVVEPDSNRIGLRLAGPAPPRRPGSPAELASEGMVLGSVQVPPSGRPVVFLADHPPTGGYPVIGVVRREDLWQCAQLRPGDEVRFRPDRAPTPGRGDATR